MGRQAVQMTPDNANEAFVSQCTQFMRRAQAFPLESLPNTGAARVDADRFSNPLTNSEV